MSSEPLDTQVERTVLSWGRTAATLAVASLFFARWADRIGPIALLPVGLGVGAAILIALLTRSNAHRRRGQFAAEQTSAPLGTAAGLCAISLILAVAGLLALWLT